MWNAVIVSCCLPTRNYSATADSQSSLFPNLVLDGIEENVVCMRLILLTIQAHSTVDSIRQWAYTREFSILSSSGLSVLWSKFPASATLVPFSVSNRRA